MEHGGNIFFWLILSHGGCENSTQSYEGRHTSTCWRYPVIGKSQLGVLLKQITCAVQGGCTSLVGMSHCSSWSAPTCAGTDLVLLKWTLEAHRASSFISNCLMSLLQKNISTVLLSLNMIILSGFMRWLPPASPTVSELSHRTAVVPKLVVLRAPFTIESPDLYIGGIFRHMS